MRIMGKHLIIVKGDAMKGNHQGSVAEQGKAYLFAALFTKESVLKK